MDFYGSIIKAGLYSSHKWRGLRIVRAVVGTISILFTCFTIGCEQKFSSLNQYPLYFADSNLIETTRERIMAESISGFLTTYTDSIEHVLVTITVPNSLKFNQLSVSGALAQSVADSIIKSIGFDEDFDSLIINFNHTESSFVFFTKTFTTKYSYGSVFIQTENEKLFQEERRWVDTIALLLNQKEFKKLYVLYDSLSTYRVYKSFINTKKILTLILDNENNLQLAKEMALKEIDKRPLNRYLNFDLGYIYYLEKNNTAAVKYLDAILRQSPNDVLSNFCKGYIYLQDKNYKLAMKHFIIVKNGGSNKADEFIDALQKAGF